MHVFGIGAFAGGAKRLDRAPIQALDAFLLTPGLDQAGHHAQHIHPRLAHKFAESPARGRIAVQGDGPPIDQGGKNQPGPHHPAQVRGPGHHIAPVNVVVQPTVHRTFDGGGVIPWNGLGIAGRAGGEKNVNPIRGVTGHGLEGFRIAQKIVPGEIRLAQLQLPPISGRQNHGPRSVGLHHLGVHGQAFPGADQYIGGENAPSAADAQTRRDLRGSEAVGNGNHRASHFDDAQVNRHGSRVHGHIHRDGVALLVPQCLEPIGDPVGPAVQGFVTVGRELGSFLLLKDHGRLIAFGAKTTFGNVHGCANQPTGLRGAPIQIQ